MAYFIDLFSPETHAAFSRSSRTISGFRLTQRGAASKLRVGDRLICYLTRRSRWVGVLDVRTPYYVDSTPLFDPADDPFIVRVEVAPLAWLPEADGLPIHDDQLWHALSFTRGHDPRSSHWAAKVRASLTRLDARDGRLLERLILARAARG